MTYPVDLQHIAMYLRKSRADVEAESRGEGETLSKHRRTLIELAKRYRYGIEEIYEEIVSGDRILDRPEMQRLLQNVQSNAYTAVLCMDIDRLGRGNMIDQGLIQEAFKTSRTLIITPRKVYNLDDEMDEEWSEFEAFMARRELKIITRRMQRGRRDSSRDGKHIGKKPPYGYLRDESLRLYPDPETAPVVRQIFQWSADGLGNDLIAHRLTDLNVPTPSGQRVWQRSSVYAILKNPVYRGHIVWGRIRYQKKPSGHGTGYEREPQPEQDWIRHENAHESLVDEETYARYRQAVDKKPKVSNKRTLSNPLASLIVCSQCNRTMVRRPRHNRPHDQLLCTTHGCDTRGSSLELVEERLFEALRNMLSNIQFERKQKGSRRDVSADKELLLRRVDDLKRVIEDLQLQRSNLHDLLERGVYDAETFLERNRIIGERLDQSQSELEEVTRKISNIDERLHQATNLGPQVIHVLDQYANAPSATEKNHLLKSIITRVTYSRKQEWTKPGQFVLDVELRF
jgi:site-specific DNA recombinase